MLVDRERRIVSQRLLGSLRSEVFELHELPQRLCDLDVEQVRRMQALGGRKGAPRYALGTLSAEQKLE
jgi:hypothetical protein